MRRFSYEGDHEEVTLYGVTFPQGEPVTVEHPALLQKLAGNKHFMEHLEPVATVQGEAAAVVADELVDEPQRQRRKPGRPKKAA